MSTKNEELFDEACQAIAEDMCRQCPNAIRCHEDCTFCDELYEAAEDFYEFEARGRQENITYTFCTIQFVDDPYSEPEEVIIKASEELDDNDDAIFFYGLTTQELIEACLNHTVLEGEWVVLSVDGCSS